ncbi:MAG: transposase, partial [Candidatus Micrarchaeota archaeon]
TWDKKRKKARKATRYLGVLGEKGGRIHEHGHVAFLHHLLRERGIVDMLKRHFPKEWNQLLAFSVNRVILPCPLKRIGSWAEKTTLENYLDLPMLSGKQLSKALARAGRNAKGQSEFMRELIERKEMLLYDGSVIFSGSGYNKLLEIGHNKDKLRVPQANITLLFSKTRNIPVYFRLFCGSVHEIRTMKAVMEEIKSKNILFIGDKGYYKNGLYDDLHAEKVKFIFPLPRDDKRIDYARQLDGVFQFHKRIIRYTSYKVGNYYIHHYEDQFLKYEETSEYYKIRLAGKKAEFHEEWAGKIALLTNKRLGPKKAYLLWKSRDRIEKAFHILQNQLDTDRPYVSHEDVFRGYMFGSFISLLAYYLVLNLLQKYDVNDGVSVDDLMLELSKVMIEDKGYPCFMEIPAKVQELAKELKISDIITKIWES